VVTGNIAQKLVKIDHVVFELQYASRQTGRQTDKQTNKQTVKHTQYFALLPGAKYYALHTAERNGVDLTGLLGGTADGHIFQT